MLLPKKNQLATVINDKWESCVHRVLNVHRKVERDWKMVYLARIEDTDRASISWKFDFGNLKVRTASLRFDTKSYENGLIKLLIFNGNGTVFKCLSFYGYFFNNFILNRRCCG